MTLHWWMHWFWITRAAVVIALLVVSPIIAAPTFQPYALPLQEEQTESQDGSLSPDWTTWDLYHISTASSVNDFSTSVAELWPSDSPELLDVSVNTYLPLETEALTSPSTADQFVPVTSIPEDVKVSIKNVPKSSTREDSSVVIMLSSAKHFPPVTSSSDSEVLLDTFSSNSQGLDKPVVNIPRLITRDLKNSSHNLSSVVASHKPEILLPTARTGKAAGYFSHLHPLFISTGLPPESSSFPPSDFLQGPKISAELTGDAAISDTGESDSRTVWVKPYDESRLKKPEDLKNNPLDETEMRDGPYSAPESSTVIVPKTRNLGEPPVPSEDFIVPTGKPDHDSPITGKENVKVTPPLLSTSKVINVTSQGGKLPDNSTRSSLLPPVVMNSEGSVGTEHNVMSTASQENSSSVHSRTPEVKNVTRTADEDDEETTVMPTVVPVSNRVQAPAPPSSHHGLDAATITGISLGILVFAALIGAVSFVLYRRRFLNKPQTLNDKCSNPDSSGYIDDSTLRENSEEMYSLDNDSFLNSLEAMTIQNYWTDNQSKALSFGLMKQNA